MVFSTDDSSRIRGRLMILHELVRSIIWKSHNDIVFSDKLVSLKDVENVSIPLA